VAALTSAVGDESGIERVLVHEFVDPERVDDEEGEVHSAGEGWSRREICDDIDRHVSFRATCLKRQQKI
jgi:hypothetical protein